MKSLSCKDLSRMDCNFTATGNSADEVKQALFTHAQSVHPDVLSSMTPDPMQEITRRMDALLG